MQRSWPVGASERYSMQTSLIWRVLLEGIKRRELRREEEVEEKKRKRDRKGGREEVQVQPRGIEREKVGGAPFYEWTSHMCRDHVAMSAQCCQDPEQVKVLPAYWPGPQGAGLNANMN